LSTFTRDPDDDILTYAIAFGNDDGFFAISNTTGVLSVVTGLDYQLAQTYTLLVIISEVFRTPSLSTGCTIFINGV
jgi:hypothetical protein